MDDGAVGARGLPPFSSTHWPLATSSKRLSLAKITAAVTVYMHVSRMARGQEGSREVL
jgi:hypothetical protein